MLFIHSAFLLYSFYLIFSSYLLVEFSFVIFEYHLLFVLLESILVSFFWPMSFDLYLQFLLLDSSALICCISLLCDKSFRLYDTISDTCYSVVSYRSITIRVFANSPGDQGSIPGRVMPKIQKWYLMPTLLNTQHYKVWIKSKQNNSEKGVEPFPTPRCSSY